MNVLLGVLSASEVLAVYWKLRVFNEVSNNALNVRSAKNAMLGRYWNGVIDGILGFPSFSISILCHGRCNSLRKAMRNLVAVCLKASVSALLDGLSIHNATIGLDPSM